MTTVTERLKQRMSTIPLHNIDIQHKELKEIWFRISRYLSTPVEAFENFGTLTIRFADQTIYIARKSKKMRLKSHLDWVYYTPKTLAHAINHNCVESYYETMMNHIHSDPNKWNDHDFEMKLKSFYAEKVGRLSLIQGEINDTTN